jgi:hypothetical protein
MTAPTRRINRGNNHSYLIDGEKADGVTWIIGNGMPKPALVGWAGRTVAEAAVERRDVWKDMSDGAAIEWLKQAPYSDRDKAANKGTRVHNLAEHLARGEEVEVPTELAGHVDSYLAFREEWKPTDELLELVVINRTHRYMGTLDLIATLVDGQRWLLDLKTNRSGPFGETALQLAAYRYAETYLDPANGDELPMPEVDRAGVVWLRADGFDLYPYIADKAQWRIFLYCQQVAHFNQDGSKTVKGEAIYPQEQAS